MTLPEPASSERIPSELTSPERAAPDPASSGSANPWLERRVLAYGHQGGAREAPSSTLYAFRHATERGVDALEMDVHATADGVLVVCHDATVDRTCNAGGSIAAMTLAEVRELDNAYWWIPDEVVDHDPARQESDYPLRGQAPTRADLRIATLDEVLAAFPSTFLNLDIKQTAPAVDSYERHLAAILREHGRVDDVIVASFNDLATERFHVESPEVHTSAGTLATAEFIRAVQSGEALPAWTCDGPGGGPRHVALQVPPAYGEVTIVSAGFVEAAHGCGIAVHVWTIDDGAEVERLVGLGVDGVMSDRPTMVVDVLTRIGAPRCT